MARHFAANKPARSILFIFDVGEEGFQNVGIPDLGKGTKIPQCDFEADKAVYNSAPSTWYANMHEQIGGGVHFLPGAMPQPDCTNFPIGATNFAQHPTIDVSKVSSESDSAPALSCTTTGSISALCYCPR